MAVAVCGGGVGVTFPVKCFVICPVSGYVVVQFYPWFNFYFLLFLTRYHTLETFNGTLY